MIRFGRAFLETSSKIVEIAYQLRNDFSEMMKDCKRMILHFNPPGFYK